MRHFHCADIINLKAIGQISFAADTCLGAVRVVTNTQIADLAAAKVTGQIYGTQNTDVAVTTAKVAAGAIIAGKIATDAVTANTIAANTLTTLKIATKAVTANEIANTITANELAANSIIAGKIAAGAVGASQIAANAIQVQHIAVSDFSNMVHDPQVKDPARWTLTSGVWSIQSTTWVGMVGGKCFFTSGTQTAPVGQTYVGYVFASDLVPVEEGLEYYLSAYVDLDTGATGNCSFRIRWCDQSGAEITTSLVGDANFAKVVSQKLSNIVTAVAGARYAQPYIRRGAASAGASVTGTVTCGGLTMQRANNGSMIVDGTLKANHMAAEVIIANTAQLGTAVVTSAAIGNLVVDTLHIKGNAVTTTVHAVKSSSVAVAISTGGSGGVPATSSGGPLIDITVNRTAGLVTKLVWSGILTPNTTDYTKFSTFRLYVGRNGTQILKTQITSDCLFDTFRSLTIVDTNTGGGATDYTVDWASDYQPNNVSCGVKTQTLKATQFKK